MLHVFICVRKSSFEEPFENEHVDSRIPPRGEETSRLFLKRRITFDGIKIRRKEVLVELSLEPRMLGWSGKESKDDHRRRRRLSSFG